MNIEKSLEKYFSNEPPGLKTNAIRWLQKKVMKKSLALPRSFETLGEWETFKSKIKKELPEVIGIPKFPELKESFVRGCVRVGADVVCERIDVYVDEDYSIPTFLFRPARLQKKPVPGVVINPGFTQSKYVSNYLKFGVRMARQNYFVVVLDHAPFGETTFNNISYIPGERNMQMFEGMALVEGMGNILGISQIALRSAETMRCGEYLRSRNEVDALRVAVTGLCQGGQDTWLSAALDEHFCAAAPVCSATTFAIHFAEMASYRSNADSSPFPFGILNICDVEHLHGAIAPRPLLVISNLSDDWWPVSGFNDLENFTRKIYRLYQAEDKCDFKFEVHEHAMTGPFADALEKFLLIHV